MLLLRVRALSNKPDVTACIKSCLVAAGLGFQNVATPSGDMACIALGSTERQLIRGGTGADDRVRPTTPLRAEVNQGDFTGIYCAKPDNFAWLIGAGASRAAGLPTASDLIWDMKKRYYAREEGQEISRQDVQNQAVRDHIQSFMLSRGFPQEGGEGEYVAYFERIFAGDKERQRKYLAAALSETKVTLSVGNRVLAALMAQKLARAVFTTNFDTVVERAMAEVSSASLSAYHLEGSAAAVQALNNEEFPLYVKLHGDFRYESLKNLAADLATQNIELGRCLSLAVSRFGLVVAGYSGRDASIMLELRRVLAGSSPFPHGLFWTGMKGVPIPAPVISLLKDARTAGVTAEYIEIETFDTLMLRLWRNVEGKPADLDAKIRKARVTDVNIAIPVSGTLGPIVRTNALPLVSLPSQCLALSFHTPQTSDEVRRTRDGAKARIILAGATDGWCWGDEDHIKTTFGSSLKAIAPVPLANDLSLPEHLHLKGFFEEAICKALAKGKPLISRTTRHASFLIANPTAPAKAMLAPISSAVSGTGGNIGGMKTTASGGHPAEQVRWAESLKLSIEVKNGRPWLLLEPDLWIWPEFARRDATKFMKQRRRDRYNSKYNALLTAWITVILGTDKVNTVVAVRPFASGSDDANPLFSIGSRTAHSKRLML